MAVPLALQDFVAASASFLNAAQNLDFSNPNSVVALGAATAGLATTLARSEIGTLAASSVALEADAKDFMDAYQAGNPLVMTNAGLSVLSDGSAIIASTAAIIAEVSAAPEEAAGLAVVFSEKRGQS